MTDVLIIGTGIAGMLAAHVLQEQGALVKLVDKGHYPGGRLASRDIGPGLADHGAQFFTVRNNRFESWVQRWQDEGLVYEWSRGWSNGSLAVSPTDGFPRYAVQGGMRRLGQHLAAGLDAHQDVQITRVGLEGQDWVAQDTAGETYTARALLLTPPVPQSLTLLDAGKVPLHGADRTALEQITYGPCLAGMFWLDTPARMPEPGAVQRPNAPIAWIADNRRKGISPNATVITVHAGPDYSRLLWNAPDWEVLVALAGTLRLYQTLDTNVIEQHLHRWRYSQPTSQLLHNHLLGRGDHHPLLAFAGDAFGSPRVEGAALSGLAAGTTLAARLG
ncbi:MAG: NAD(P)-binding protein [Chloroflexi bacterium]|nr:NAD(P)-binding protein [Chloroflexota bacterium]